MANYFSMGKCEGIKAQVSAHLVSHRNGLGRTLLKVVGGVQPIMGHDRKTDLYLVLGFQAHHRH